MIKDPGEIERRLCKIEGRPVKSCIDVAIHAYDIRPTEEDRLLARAVQFPFCIMQPTSAASAAMVEFMERYLRVVQHFTRAGECCLMGIKTSRQRPDHVGVLTNRGLWHYRIRGVVECVPPSVKMDSLLARTLMVFAP